jgi:uncharacterized coiled-coil protein SlyX
MPISELIAWGGYIMAGGFAIVGAFNMQRQKQRNDNDVASSNLINKLKITVDLQEKEITSLHLKEVDQGKEIAHLQGQVKVLADILQGRDPQQVEIFKQAPAIFEIARENNRMSRANNEAITTLTEKISNLIESIQPLVNTLERV